MPVAPYAFEQLAGVEVGRGEDVLSAAWAEAEQVRAAAHAEGFAAGRAEALASFGGECAPALAALVAAARSLDASRDEAVAVLEQQAGIVAIAVAEQILGASIALDAGLVVEVCRGALRRLAERERVTVLVHPADLEALSSAVDDLVAALGGIEHFEVQADRRVGRGGCVVRTAHGEIDATLATQLTRAREVLEAAMRSDADDA